MYKVFEISWKLVEYFVNNRLIKVRIKTSFYTHEWHIIFNCDFLHAVGAGPTPHYVILNRISVKCRFPFLSLQFFKHLKNLPLKRGKNDQSLFSILYNSCSYIFLWLKALSSGFKIWHSFNSSLRYDEVWIQGRVQMVYGKNISSYMTSEILSFPLAGRVISGYFYQLL